MGKKGPLWWRESDWLLRGSSAANQILLRHSGPILSFSAEVPQQQTIPRQQKLDAVRDEIENKTEFNKNYNVAASKRNSRVTTETCAKKLYKCYRCKSEFQEKLHLAIHKIKYKYNMCKCNRSDRKCGISPHLGHYSPNREKHQTKRSNSSQQQRTHNREKPFQCVQCNKAFAQKRHLTCHLRTHSGEKPFQCVQCNKAFARKPYLTLHLRTHSGEKPFQCVQCNKTFARKPHLTCHLRTHSGEKPFQCDQCNKAFAQKHNLTNHLRTHSGEKPFQCVQCNKTFAQKSDLTYHHRAHSGERPFHCVTRHLQRNIF